MWNEYWQTKKQSIGIDLQSDIVVILSLATGVYSFSVLNYHNLN